MKIVFLILKVILIGVVSVHVGLIVGGISPMSSAIASGLCYLLLANVFLRKPYK